VRKKWLAPIISKRKFNVQIVGWVDLAEEIFGATKPLLCM
jgi:hypothetical protein